MLKNKLWVLLLFAACAPKTPDRIVTGEWLNSRAQFVPSRVPAAGPPAANCRNELFTLDEIKREALHYQAQLESERKLTGTWKHLSLGRLPVAQAKFLKAVGTKFGDLNDAAATDVSACEDAPCVVNAVYKSADGLEGWAIYLWYLKMGNILSFKNKVFEQKDARAGVYGEVAYPLTDYLFSRDELYAFWRMSHALPTMYKTLTDLKEIQRIPRKANIEDRTENTCGLAYSQGYIVLNDGCLSFSLTKDSGFIYAGTTHEMAHQIDFHWGRRDSINSFYFSDNGAWQAAGGWSINEYRDEATQQMVRQWVTSLTNQQFVRDYARTSPVEHFADTAAYYRYEGETTKTKVPTAIYSILKNSIYEQQDYDAAGLLSQFQTSAVQLFSADVFKAVAACEDNVASRATDPIIPAGSFPFAVGVEMRRCLGGQLQSLVEQAVTDAKLQHVDGCRMMRVPQRLTEYKQKIQSEFLQQMAEHIRTSRENQDYFNRLKEFYKNLDQRVVPLRLMTGCYGDVDEKKCYHDAIDDLLAEIIPDDMVQAENLQIDLRKMFLEANRFEAVKVETIKVHQDFIFTQSELVFDSAKKLWDSCRAAPVEDHDAPVSGPLSLGEGWMASSQYNCLNREISKETRSVVGEMSFDQLGVTDGKEGKLLFDLTQPLFVKEIKQLYENDLQVEEARIEKTKQESSQIFDQKLKNDFSWARRPGSFLQQDCESEAFSALPQDFRYHKRTEVFTPMARSYCQTLLKSTEFVTWMNTQRVFIEEQLVSQFMESIQRLSDTRVEGCLEKYPINNIFQSVWNKKKCRRCYKEDWQSLEDTAWNEAIASLSVDLTIERSSILPRVAYRVEAIQEDVYETKCKSNSLGIRLENPF
jgi:hypothetical protein